MNTNVKDFAKLAIENGYTGSECKQGSGYKEEVVKGKKTCAGYTWYD